MTETESVNLAVKSSERRLAGRYDIRSLLGKGAMGEVYLAFDTKLEREVAVKVISSPFAAQPKARDRFHREARATVQLKHPNIVETLDYSGPGSTDLFLVMERLNGQNLFNLLSKNGPFPEAIAAAFLHELCLALEHAHGQGVIHRDLKPENVIVEWHGRVVLTDFGLVKAFSEENLLHTQMFERTDVLGTPGFMSPEQIKGEDLGPHSDVFALGAMFYNLLTGELPFSANNFFDSRRQIEQGIYEDPRKIRPELSTTTASLIEDCIRSRARRRIQSAYTLRQRLVPIFRRRWSSTRVTRLSSFYVTPRGMPIAFVSVNYTF